MAGAGGANGGGPADPPNGAYGQAGGGGASGTSDGPALSCQAAFLSLPRADLRRTPPDGQPLTAATDTRVIVAGELVPASLGSGQV